MRHPRPRPPDPQRSRCRHQPRTWTELDVFDRPFLTAFSDGDEASRGWDGIFQERVPGAKGQRHTTIAGAGHFLQEDKGGDLAEVMVGFMAANGTSV